jgi:hypothetical protein
MLLLQDPFRDRSTLTSTAEFVIQVTHKQLGFRQSRLKMESCLEIELDISNSIQVVPERLFRLKVQDM